MTDTVSPTEAAQAARWQAITALREFSLKHFRQLPRLNRYSRTGEYIQQHKDASHNKYQPFWLPVGRRGQWIRVIPTAGGYLRSGQSKRRRKTADPVPLLHAAA